MFFIYRGDVYARCDGGLFTLRTWGFYDTPMNWFWELVPADEAEAIRKDYERTETPATPVR
jgi:hypothetical protein